MKFVTYKGSPVFEAIVQFGQRVSDANKACYEFAATIPGVDATKLAFSNRFFGGGIAGFKFISGMPPLTGLSMFGPHPSDWKKVQDADGDSYYFPKKNRPNVAHLFERMEALPFVLKTEAASLVGLKPQMIPQGAGTSIYVEMPDEIVLGTNFHLYAIHEEVDYTPPIGVKEITVSEYKALKKQLDIEEENRHDATVHEKK